MWRRWWRGDDAADLGFAQFAALTRVLRACQPASAVARLGVGGKAIVFRYNYEHFYRRQ